MNIKSYAQNLEDVMLWRALGKFSPGFYIDVGACDPVVESVTKAFYDAGWRGINIEPMNISFKTIMNARPRDINLNLALDNKKGTKTFYSVDNGNGLSTSIESFSEQYIAEGKQVEKINVETDTLLEICKTFVNQEIHFLKIDVEGAELAVLQGADFNQYRPWIILIESTKPNTTISSFSDWEPLVLACGYKFVYFDGLNRFYLANEKVNLLESCFSAPPNCFDQYELNQYISLAHSLEHQITSLNSRNNGLEVLVKITETRLQELNTEINACYQEIFENSQHIGCLSKERSNAHYKIQSLDELVHQKDTAIKSLVTETEQKDTTIKALATEMEQKDTTIKALVTETEQKDTVIKLLEDEIRQKNVALKSLEDFVQQKDITIKSINDQVAELRASRSWRIMQPARSAVSFIKYLLGKKNATEQCTF